MKRLILLVILLLMVTGCSAKKDDVKKDAKSAGSDMKSEIEGNTVRTTMKDIIVEGAYLTPEATDLYFSAFKGGRYKNPFPGKAYLIFTLSITNNSAKKVMTYNPGMTFLSLENGRLLLQKDYTSLYTDLEAAEADDIEGRMEAFRVSSFDTSVTVNPGETIQGLLVFPHEKDVKLNKIGLLIDRLYLDHDSKSIPLLFSPGMIEEEVEGEVAPEGGDSTDGKVDGGEVK